MPTEGNFEEVWWISMLQGVLLAAVYMCMLAKELPLETVRGAVQDKQVMASDGRKLPEAQPTRNGGATEAAEAC